MVLMNSPSPAMMIVELFPRFVCSMKALMAVVSCCPKVFASEGRLLTFVAKEKPLPSMSKNMTFAASVKLLGLTEKVISLLRFTGPTPLIP